MRNSETHAEAELESLREKLGRVNDALYKLKKNDYAVPLIYIVLTLCTSMPLLGFVPDRASLIHSFHFRWMACIVCTLAIYVFCCARFYLGAALFAAAIVAFSPFAEYNFRPVLFTFWKYYLGAINALGIFAVPMAWEAYQERRFREAADMIWPERRKK